MDDKGTFVHWTSDKKEIIHIVYGFNNFEYAYECINARYIKMSCLVVILIWHLLWVVKWYALFLGTFDTIENVFIWLLTIYMYFYKIKLFNHTILIMYWKIIVFFRLSRINPESFSVILYIIPFIIFTTKSLSRDFSSR